MTPGRRAELAEWARATGAFVIEDDYDAEYRYDRHPVGRVAGRRPRPGHLPGHAVQEPGPGAAARLARGAARPHRRARVRPQGGRPHDASLIQATFAEFLDRGDLDRHLRRTRRTYRERRDAVVGALAEWLPEWCVSGVSAGLQAFVTLPEGVDSADVADTARRHGIGVYPVADELLDADRRASSLLLGYGTLRPSQIRDGIRRLAAAVGVPA